ncbi:MAG: hypothetical protein RMI45_05070 [Ignisphaera sp.]|nr:hypothetical protein [Ignisphaera sp.]MDW8085590.1 hypothetical protein [Ignisphaera sp.]
MKARSPQQIIRYISKHTSVAVAELAPHGKTGVRSRGVKPYVSLYTSAGDG